MYIKIDKIENNIHRVCYYKLKEFRHEIDSTTGTDMIYIKTKENHYEFDMSLPVTINILDDNGTILETFQTL